MMLSIPYKWQLITQVSSAFSYSKYLLHRKINIFFVNHLFPRSCVLTERYRKISLKFESDLLSLTYLAS